MLTSTADQQPGEYRVFCLCKDKTIEGKDLQLHTYLLCLWRVWRQDFWPTLRFLEESFWSLKESARKFIEIMKFIKCLFCFSPLQCCKLPPRLWLYVNFWHICFPSKYEKKFFTRIPFHPLALSVDLTIEPCHQNCDFRFSPKYVFPFENMNFLQKYVFLNKICISFKNIIFQNMYIPSVSLLQNMQWLTAWISIPHWIHPFET